MTVDFRLGPLKRLSKKFPSIFDEALKVAALQFLNWANNGSANSPKKPPIRWGVLRGSSSAFVGSKLVNVFPQSIKAGAKERPTPNTSHRDDATTITWGWNTDYAAKMHEWDGGWGPFTEQDGEAGNKWLEAHLQADKESLIELIARTVKKKAGM